MRDECRNNISMRNSLETAPDKKKNRNDLSSKSSTPSLDHTLGSSVANEYIDNITKQLSSENKFIENEYISKKRGNLTSLETNDSRDQITSTSECTDLSMGENPFGISYSTPKSIFSDHISNRNQVISTDVITSDVPFKGFESKSKESSMKEMMRHNKIPNTIALGSVTAELSTLNINKKYKQSGKPNPTKSVVDESDFDVLQKCIMPLSYIGRSFLVNDSDYEEETIRIFKDLADLHKSEKDAALYLPSIIARHRYVDNSF